jgi:hypothetical protein
MALAGHRRCPHAPIPLELLVVVTCSNGWRWNAEVFCILQFHIPDLRVGTLDSLLALSDDLTKVRDSLLAHRASLRSVASWNRCRVCWRNFGFCTIPRSRFSAASSGILGLWRWLLCRRIRSWRGWHTRWRGRLTSWSEWPLQIPALLLWMAFLSILMSPGELGNQTCSFFWFLLTWKTPHNFE